MRERVKSVVIPFPVFSSSYFPIFFFPYCPKNRKRRVNSAKKIGKNTHPADVPCSFHFPETLQALRKSIIRTFGKVLANADM